MASAKHPVAAMMMLAAIPLGASAASDDAYTALKRYDGTWNATFSTGRALTIQNHCAHTGLFFVCEQSVSGKPAALVVFLPSEAGEGVFKYRTQTLDAAGDPPGPWRALTIKGDRWVYETIETGRGRTRRERTVNTFSGTDFIHFETQTSADGETWTTTNSGDEHRAP